MAPRTSSTAAPHRRYTSRMPRWLRNWFDRHRHPVSLALHMMGIPMTVAFIPLAIVQWMDNRWDLWWRPTLLFAGGYALQWVGHVIEGNDMGEVILVKRWLGKPYVAIAPPRETSAGQNAARAAVDRLPTSATHKE